MLHLGLEMMLKTVPITDWGLPTAMEHAPWNTRLPFLLISLSVDTLRKALLPSSLV